MSPAPFIPNPDFDREAQEAFGGAAMEESAEDLRQRVDEFVRASGGPWVPNKEGRQPVELVEQDGELYVVLTDHAGHLMEFGGGRSSPTAPLRKGAMAAGAEVSED